MTIQGQKSLISLIKTFPNVVFICMCNYLSKLCDELKDYFTIFNYNCFGNILKNHIKGENNSQRGVIFDLLLTDSDIRFYNNEKYRIELLKDDDIYYINSFVKTTTTEIQYLILNNASINTILHYIDDDKLNTIQRLSSIDKEKLKLIIYQEVFDGLLDNKVNTEYLCTLLEHILFTHLEI